MKRLASFGLALACASGSALAANEQTIGDWMVPDATGTGASMFTFNDSSSIFGKWCWGDSCYWILALDTRCEDGVKAPALLSLNDATMSVILTCFGSVEVAGKTYYRNGISGPDDIDKNIVNAKRASFALPLVNDQFKVVRFNTDGAEAALRLWRFKLSTQTKSKPDVTDKPTKKTNDVFL